MSSTPLRRWPITLGGYLQLIQCGVLLGTGFALGLASGALDARAPEAVREANLGLVIAAVLCVTWGLAAFLNALMFLQRRRSAWLIAMLVQGLSLTLALLLYWRGQRLYGYPLMVLGILLVLHLNRGDVLEVFRVKTTAELPQRTGDASDAA